MSSGTGGEIQFIYQKEHNWDFFGHHRCYQSLGQDRTGLLGYSPTRAQCVPSAYPSTCLSMSTGCFCACLWGEWVPPAAPRASLQPHAPPGPSGVQGTLRPGQEQPEGTISGDSQWGTPRHWSQVSPWACSPCDHRHTDLGWFCTLFSKPCPSPSQVSTSRTTKLLSSTPSCTCDVPGQHQLHLTLSFHIIYHRAGCLHRHITGPGASPCVVDSPEGEPGRGGQR